MLGQVVGAGNNRLAHFVLIDRRVHGLATRENENRIAHLALVGFDLLHNEVKTHDALFYSSSSGVLSYRLSGVLSYIQSFVDGICIHADRGEGRQGLFQNVLCGPLALFFA